MGGGGAPDRCAARCRAHRFVAEWNFNPAPGPSESLADAMADRLSDTRSRSSPTGFSHGIAHHKRAAAVSPQPTWAAPYYHGMP